MGQLLGMLLRGDPNRLITSAKEVRKLDCDKDLKEIIAKAIGPRRTRYENACEMLRALRGDGDIFHP
jgi:hypothetical protein